MKNKVNSVERGPATYLGTKFLFSDVIFKHKMLSRFIFNDQVSEAKAIEHRKVL